MEQHSQAIVLYDGVILLGGALLLVLVFRKFGLGATLGYLVAGALVGPSGFGLIGDAEGKIGFAELGIVLLLFIVGLELAPSRLWRLRKEIFGLGLLQVVLCGLALTAAIGLLAGFGWATAFAIGLPLALSSTAQVLPMLQSSGRLHTPFGERAFSTLLFQDISIIPLITIVAALGAGSADHGPPGWQLAITAVLAVFGLIAVGRFGLRPMFRLIGRLGEREMFVVAALFVVVGASALMVTLGLSPALGAFVAGVMLADTPYRHELEADVEPFRSILLGLFFISVGMMLDLGAIAEQPLFVFGMAVGVIVIKTAVIFGLGRLFGLPWRGALALGLLLSQGGEFGFVLFAQAQGAGLLDAETASLIGAVVTLSMATTPFLMMATERLRREPESSETREGPTRNGSDVLIVGYGRFGQTTAQMLMASGLTVTLIDRDAARIDIAREFGSRVYFGDGTRIDLLRQAGAAEVRAIAFCMDGDQANAGLIEAVHEAFPEARLMVRAFDRRTVMDLSDAPTCAVVREVFESAVDLARRTMDALDFDEAEILGAEQTYRAVDRKRLDAQSEAGDIRAASDIMITEPRREL
jgi:CPA2 family monovalent cation:H+ antiporter-2/glutathione-regulated potassium-efflux system protein KefB